MFNSELDAKLNEGLYGDSRPRMRINGTVEDKYGDHAVVGVSVPVGATEDEKKAIFDSIMKITNDIADFNRLSREEQLDHYLDIAVKALYEIMNSCHTDLRDLKSEDWTNPVIKNMMGKISHASCTADMALVMIPSSITDRARP